MWATDQISQAVKPAIHRFGWQGLGKIVVLVAVGTGKIAAADGYDVRKDGMSRGEQGFRDHPQLSHSRANKSRFSLYSDFVHEDQASTQPANGGCKVPNHPNGTSDHLAFGKLEPDNLATIPCKL